MPQKRCSEPDDLPRTQGLTPSLSTYPSHFNDVWQLASPPGLRGALRGHCLLVHSTVKSPRPFIIYITVSSLTREHFKADCGPPPARPRDYYHCDGRIDCYKADSQLPEPCTAGKTQITEMQRGSVRCGPLLDLPLGKMAGTRLSRR